VFSILMRGGAISTYNNDPVPYQYRYALGYQNMRGFYFAGVGPHVAFDTYNPTTGDTTTTYMANVGLRGNYYYVASFELRMPTPMPKEYGVHLVAFMDIGSSFGIDGLPMSPAGTGSGCAPGEAYCTTLTNGNTRREYVVDSAIPRIAVGGGILWMSPMAPIRLEFAAAVFQQAYDVPLIVRLHFSAMPI
jgi:outer membrane protein insertion porin family